ncbi:MAG: cellulase family glycosylhydrolase [Pyrinomonadaceae bacterium]|nr:cellulase family glycosylhydrolase [Pyrinomonadaceae bacterium]
MLKRLSHLIFLLVVCGTIVEAKSIATQRSEKMGVGMNLSYLDNYWLGKKENRFADFFDPIEFEKRKPMLDEIAKHGFRTVRIPVCFSAWVSFEKPYRWTLPEGLKAVDDLVKRALDNGLIVIIDLHHTELDGSVPGAASTERIKWIWSEVAKRYKNSDPEKVFFELRNEPHDIEAEVWRNQADELIKTIREIAPKHTLVVGFHDWNSRKALIDSKPFSDKNIIYTFHYYDPFLFTHQGATWSAEGLAEAKSIPFPLPEKVKLKKPPIVKGNWVDGLYKTYSADSKKEKMVSDLEAAKNWSKKHDVPIFLGEFGSFGKHIAIEDRCRHAKLIYSALGRLKIPNAWWEWDAGFSMFEKGTGRIAACMKDAVSSYESSRPDGWSLTWSDEFNGKKNSAIDKSRWTARIGGKGWGNQEYQYYTDSIRNAYQNGRGSLVIKAIKEDLAPEFKCWYGKCKYTSARLVTKDNFEQKHGRFEARIKVPAGAGMWAAFWMLGNNFDEVGWAKCGEIDIMENIGREPQKVYGTIHGPGYEGAKGIGKSFSHRSKAKFSESFHVYAIEWEKGEIRWYVDGEHYQTRNPSDLPNNTNWVYEHPFFILLNLAVGGRWPKDPNKSTKFPAEMLVDYVRVYERVGG